MKTLREIIKDAETRRVAVGHFNISDSVALKAIFEAGRELKLPIIIGVSEGERDFLGVRQVAALIKILREEYDYPIFLNADHTHSLEKIKEAVDAGFDAVLFDGSKLSIDENIKKTREAVTYAKNVNPNILVEGEVGYIGGGSSILEKIPEDAAIRGEDLTTTDQAAYFVKKTGVDLFSPAVGNIHGILRDQPNPRLNILRIKEIRKAAGVPLVLHGGSGIDNEDFLAAIDAGISVIHINTELRLAWRKGLEKALGENPKEVTPYKLLPGALEEIKKVVISRLKLFNKLS